MKTLQPLDTPEWLTLHEAAAVLGVTSQAISQASRRLGFSRRSIGNVVLVSRADVELYRRSRRRRGSITVTD